MGINVKQVVCATQAAVLGPLQELTPARQPNGGVHVLDYKTSNAVKSMK